VIFDNFAQIKEGSFIDKFKTRTQLGGHLTRKTEWTEEKIGDYLGPKIPSLLEFFENKIHLKEVMGTSHILPSERAP